MQCASTRARSMWCGSAHHQRCKSMQPVKRPFPLLYRYRLIPAPYSPTSSTTPRRAHTTAFSVPSSFPCARPLLPSSDRSAGQRNQPSHSTVLARPVSDLGLNFPLASAYCTRAHTLSLDSYCRPTSGKSSSPAGRSTLAHAYVVDRARLPLHILLLSRLRLFQRHLQSLVGI